MVEPTSFHVELPSPARDVAVVEASGELDLLTSSAFRDCLVGAIEVGAARVVVDLTKVTFVDSSALGVLVGGTRRSAELGSQLMIVCPPGSVARVIEIAGLNRAFTIYATRDEALGAFVEGTAR
jgi:anti-sigma B factor antagonist